MEPKRAVLLLSGGLDSATVLALAVSEGYAIHALSFDYGQRHSVELSLARKIAQHYGVIQHVVMRLALRVFGGSALTADMPVPKDRPIESSDDTIPATYVPARNTIF